MWALSDDELGSAVGELGALSANVEAHLFAVVAEARRRGLGTADGWGPTDWTRAMAPQLASRTHADLDVMGAAADEPRLKEVTDAVMDAASSADDRVGAAQGESGTAGVGYLPLGKAAQIVRFHRSVRGLADATELEGVTEVLLHSARGADGLGERQLATAIRYAGQVLRPDKEAEDDADRRRAHRSLIKGKGPLGLARYILLLDEEGAAIVDAAVDALAKPRRDEDTGERDPRTPAARRADALLDLIQRAVGAPDGVPRQAKTSVSLTIDYETLAGRCRGAGVTMEGEVLTPATVRRLACDALIIPVVLGSRGEVLDQGEAQRLFTRPQIRHLWLRDGGCTFPGCSKPAAWTDAHHLVHWVDGGPTDIGNAALLCRAHHTVVHSNRYAGRVVEGARGPRVEWDLSVDSYDRAAAEVPHRAGTRRRQ
ncbi:HNH endonuclease signature motif containing protein [Knoellia aerolata]|uniref:HNH nuclease domain-containing protein n=1 Tax=Knoellia aerolata DSM 18566 TaxID=1385519 RepID=A0A0A0JWH3_9MICO|nr:HNH endonuclease signature motif containing protein [Knoellia aerolata]KGN41800.1 hypothetical protein N801_04535 [Knoellia aerolata DSM 18566]